MSVIQSTQPELRYSKRQNLENEARIIGNYYRDIIRSYGVDCIYHKLDKSEFSNFKNIIDRNTILKQAYGYNIDPDYSMSAHTLTYMEVENDIFQLNKFGLNPDLDVNFYFENNDFACALATKCGQYKEYPIDEIVIECEVPECTNEFEEFDDDINKFSGKQNKNYLSASIFPYELGLGYKENYTAGMLSGRLYVAINGYEVDKEQNIVCNPYEHTDFNIEFDSNSDLYKSLKHKIESDDYLETMIYLTFKVTKFLTTYKKADVPLNTGYNSTLLYSTKNYIKKLYKYFSYNDEINIDYIEFENIHTLEKVKECINIIESSLALDITDFTETDIKASVDRLYNIAKDMEVMQPVYKYILSGKIHGNVLFYDTIELGKYAEKIHPSVGDIVTIDFPDENNREKYEITDCFDKQLTQDGISPLLHKYIWKCKARRYVNSFEDMEQSEADDRMQEKLDHQAQVYEKVADEISFYEDNEDRVYGGYELHKDSVKNYDKQDVRNIEHVKYEGLPEGQLINIQSFECGSRICTDGYALVFVTKHDEMYIVTTINRELAVRDAVFESGIKWLKATKDQICFVNITGEISILACDNVSNYVEEINLDDLYNVSIETGNINQDNGSFIKFNGCRSYIFATPTQLFAKLENNQKTYQII